MTGCDPVQPEPEIDSRAFRDDRERSQSQSPGRARRPNSVATNDDAVVSRIHRSERITGYAGLGQAIGLFGPKVRFRGFLPVA
jgi:hypothetical protein